MPWIDCQERMPEDDQRVIAHFVPIQRPGEPNRAKPTVREATYIAGKDGAYWSIPAFWNWEATHWMPMPELPEEEG